MNDTLKKTSCVLPATDIPITAIGTPLRLIQKKIFPGKKTDYPDEAFLSAIHEINRSRISLLTLFIAMLHIPLLYFDFINYKNGLSTQIPGYHYLFILHLFGFAIFLAGYGLFNSRLLTENKIAARIMIRISICVFMGTITAVAIVDQLIHGQITSYIAMIFTTAVFIYLSAAEVFILFVINAFALLTGILFLQDDPHIIFGHINNVITMTLIAIVISRIHYFNKLKEYRNNQIIFNQKLDIESTLEKSRVDYYLAGQIQSAILNNHPPEVDDWDIAFLYKPMTGVSGDLYDFYCRDGRLTGLSLFDVSGHGISSGLVTIMAKTLMFHHFRLMKNKPLNEVVEQFNADLSREMLNTNLYLSGIVLRITGNSVEYVNAGHPDILIYNQKTKKHRTLIHESNHEARGHFLGLEIMQNAYPMTSFDVEINDSIILFTDGLTESRSGSELYEEKIIDVLNNLPSECTTSSMLLNYIYNDYKNFTKNGEISDDLTIIVITKKH